MENPLYIPFVNFNIYNIDEPDEEQNIKNINLLIDYTKDPNNFDLFINLLRTYRFLNKDKTVINNIRHSLTGETCMVSASEADNYLMMIYLICNWNCTISTDKQFNQLLTIMRISSSDSLSRYFIIVSLTMILASLYFWKRLLTQKVMSFSN
jgi:hypothetical protein